MPERPAEGDRPATPGRPALVWELAEKGGRLTGTQTRGEEKWPLTGVRAPALQRAAPAAWGPPEPLFNGKDLSNWHKRGSDEPAGWTVGDGYFEVKPGTGDICTKETFGSFQLHVEFWLPLMADCQGQARANSGVYIQGRYEVQVLDSHQNPTYYHGQAGAIYKQSPPLVNASRPPGEWQSFDIIFRAPRRNAAGQVIKPATITVLHNGILVQDHFEILGNTRDRNPRYESHPDKLPLSLQDHGNPVRYRNIWIREL